MGGGAEEMVAMTSVAWVDGDDDDVVEREGYNNRPGAGPEREIAHVVLFLVLWCLWEPQGSGAHHMMSADAQRSGMHRCEGSRYKLGT